MTKENIIKKTIFELAGKRSYKGFDYAVYGILLTIDNPKRLQHISKSLYIDIASKLKTNWKNVEKNIRTLTDVIWKNKDNELLKKICKGKVTGKPNNKDFFILMSEYIIYLEENEEIAASNDNQFGEPFKEYVTPLYDNLMKQMQANLTAHEKEIEMLGNIFNLLSESLKK